VSNLPWNGFKGDGHEGGSRVPAIISHPDFRDATRRTDAVVTIRDLAPSILDWVGQDPSDTSATLAIQGRSLANLFVETEGTVYSDQDILGWETMVARGIVVGDWRLVGHVAGPGKFGGYALYNLAKDPFEQNDLSKTEPAQMKIMLKAWDAYVKENGVIIGDRLPFDAPAFGPGKKKGPKPQ